MFNNVYNAAIDALFDGFARENTAMKTLLAVPAVQEHLQRLAGLQDVEHERDLPATIAESLASTVAS